ncbi:endoplasmic reticulum oxidoreductin-1 [Cryptomeria japonica]|uniref:endoplasmic reticulum oxidoreductin-1 n=1 Tax=Cryptomeria japonica TaxID=3369 RepID=UPI0027DA1741|nr:endoplasmic reticulum oxidoreductin-1 [Cryptomeria japonica]
MGEAMAEKQSEETKKRRRNRIWGWKTWSIIGVAVILAVSVAAYGRQSKISLFGVSTDDCTCLESPHKLSGIVEDCCCDYKTVDTLNNQVLHPLLQDLVRTPFFRYFKARLWCDCPFWPDDGMCRLRDCSVCECPDNEFPKIFKTAAGHLPTDDLTCQEGKPQAVVDRTLDKKAFRGWMETDNPWTHDDERDNSEMTYVNLLLNPERYTGYTGPSAQRIWDTIYKKHCLKDLPGDTSPERRVLYKLISGLHSSISVHIAREYLLDEEKNLWGPNPTLLYERVLKHPDRVRNLYFTYLFVLRAVTKAGDYLSQAEYSTDNSVEEQNTFKLVNQLVNNNRLRSACPVPYDEAKIWKGENGRELKSQVQSQFKTISALMDCVGCEKCRLWGKLQILGLGTAFKILFSEDSNDTVQLQLHRNEVIALINLLSRLSESVQAVHSLGPEVDNEFNNRHMTALSLQSV